MQEDTFHCQNCGICVNGKDHKCIFKNIQNSSCSICLEDLFDSREQIHVPKCGHAIHVNCFQNYIKTNYKCPMCKKSLYDINSIIEAEVNRTIMHPDLIKDVDILCNDCEEKSICKFHIIAMKCSNCGSYNTSQIHK